MQNFNTLPESEVVKQMTISEDEVLVKDFGQKIEFFENHLVATAIGKWDVLDDKMGVRRIQFIDATVHIPSECDLAIFLDDEAGEDKRGLWIVVVDVCKFYFKSKGDAQKLFKKISEWKTTSFS